MNVTRRPEEPRDATFIQQLILDTLVDELGAANWPEPMRTHLLGIQVGARRHSGRANFPEAVSEVIHAGGVQVGWMLMASMPHELRLVEIMVAPPHRGQGIGSAVIRELLTEADGRPVRLTVNVTNTSAIRLYERLGFRKVDNGPEADPVQHLMEQW